jgi:membrane-associated phospholipid phosphatase
MNPLDFHVITFLNQFAHRSWSFDYFVLLISKNYVLKTGVITALLGFLWFRERSDDTDHRATLLFGLLASCGAVLIARILSVVVPFRERPLRSPFLHFVRPFDVDPQAILGWSAFPSDNAALFFGLAASIYLLSRRAGILVFCHMALVIGFARVYLGYHHPTDILAGALLGVGCVSLVHVASVRTALIRVPLRWMQQHPPSFHAALFVLVFLIATTFEPLYPLAGFAFATTKATITFTAAVYRTITLAAVPR